MSQTVNVNCQVAEQATYTATSYNSPQQENFYYRGGHFIFDVVTVNSGSYTPHIQGYDPSTGIWYDILVGVAITSQGVTILKVYPGIGQITNAAANDILPLIWRVQLIGANTPSMVLAVSANLVI